MQLVVYGAWSFFCQLHAFHSLFEQGGTFSFQQCLLLNISRPLERWCHLYIELALCVVKDGQLVKSLMLFFCRCEISHRKYFRAYFGNQLPFKMAWTFRQSTM